MTNLNLIIIYLRSTHGIFVHVDSVPLLCTYYLQRPVLDVIGEHKTLALVGTAPTLGDRGPAAISADLCEAGHGRTVGAATKIIRDADRALFIARKML